MEAQLSEIRIFENYSISMIESGHAIYTTEVTENALNIYGQTHGGYLYTLCDTAAGMAAISTGSNVVTLRADISYIKSAGLGEVLTVEGVCIHNGRTTKAVEASVTNQDGKLICKGTFTMYVTGELKTEQK